MLHRLKGAVNNLVMGKAASQGLDQWLFDINKARTPQEIKKISTWQNSGYQRKTKRSGRKNIVCSGCMFNSGLPEQGKQLLLQRQFINWLYEISMF